jgi:hypothetical protein
MPLMMRLAMRERDRMSLPQSVQLLLSLRFFFKRNLSAPTTRHVLCITVVSAGFLAGSLSAYNDLTS